MGCLYYFFTWPLYFMYYTFIVMFYMLYYSVIICYHIFRLIVSLIIEIFAIIKAIIGKNNQKKYYSKPEENNELFFQEISPLNIKTKSKEKISWREEEFEREANLWGLSKEDRRIAKEERMSPADFIEAEERDDDELFTDEWE